MKRIAGISLVLLLAACNTATKLDTVEDSRFTSIRELQSFCPGEAKRITQEVKIRGIVTANDMRGEFPRMLVIEDKTGGIEISVDHDALADLFPLGAEVTVYCTGLMLHDYGGKIRLGAEPTGNAYRTYCIDRTEINRYLRCTQLNAHKRRARLMQLEEATASDADCYVRFENVRFAEAGRCWCDPDPETGKLRTTYRLLTDAQGDSLPVRSLPSVHYAAEPVPFGTGSVNGILDYFNGQLSLRIVNYEVDFPLFAGFPTAYPSVVGHSAPTQRK